MSAEAPAEVRTWSVGRYLCTLTLARPRAGQVMHASVEWSPAMPKRLTDSEVREYRAGRDAAIAEIAQMLGITVGVVDL